MLEQCLSVAKQCLSNDREHPPDLSRIFLLSILSLHLDSQLSIESSNHQKIGDINEALRICKQATQIASV